MNAQGRVFVKHGCCVVLLAVLCCRAQLATAGEATYPTRAVRLVVPWAPGGAADALARLITPRLSESMGQVWVVDNRGGGAGNLAAEIVAHAQPDGYTVFMAFSSVVTVNPFLYKLRFNFEKDFQPVTTLSMAEQILVCHPSLPAKSLREFIALAKQKPGGLNYASAGVGSSNHLAMELLKKRAGIDVVHVAYSGGGPAATATLTGETQVLMGSVAGTLSYINTGRLRALATTGLKRSKATPDVPTVAESGYPDYEVVVWNAILVPSGTPKNIAERLRNEMIKALRPDIQATMEKLGMTPETTTPAELARRIKTETETWGGLIRDLGIKPN